MEQKLAAQFYMRRLRSPLDLVSSKAACFGFAASDSSMQGFFPPLFLKDVFEAVLHLKDSVHFMHLLAVLCFSGLLISI